MNTSYVYPEMRLEIYDGSSEGWTKIASAFADISIMQTGEYGASKAALGKWSVERFLLVDSGEIVGAVQALVRNIPVIGGGLVWINQGPLWRKGGANNSCLLLEMLALLRKYYVDERRLYLRVLPSARVGDVSLQDLERAGLFVVEDSEGWHSAMVDLRPSLDEIRSGLARKWRGDLNASERRGAECVAGTTDSLLDEFMVHYEPFLIERNIESQLTAEFLFDLQKRLPEGRKMWIFEARFEDEVLGGLLIATYGKIALALAGSNPNARGRQLKSGNLVWWNAIIKMKELGFEWLDVGGTSPTFTNKGILHFKEGLSGQGVSLVKEFEASRNGLRDRFIRWRISKARS